MRINWPLYHYFHIHIMHYPSDFCLSTVFDIFNSLIFSTYWGQFNSKVTLYNQFAWLYRLKSTTNLILHMQTNSMKNVPFHFIFIFAQKALHSSKNLPCNENRVSFKPPYFIKIPVCINPFSSKSTFWNDNVCTFYVS